MPLSHVIRVQIDVAYDRVYAYLADPRNYPEWAAVHKSTFRQLEDGDWVAETLFGGLRHFRFTPPNDAGILDHAIFRPGEELLWMPMRLEKHGEGTELLFTFIQRPGMSPEAFASSVEWVTTDFLTLKSLLEALYSGKA